MVSFCWKKLFVALLVICTARSAVAQEEGPLAFLEDKYRGLDKKGKFVAGATVGFVGSRLALKTAVSALKIGAACYITSEVLSYTGVLEDLPALSEEQADLIRGVKQTVIKRTNGFRASVRRRLGPDAVQHIFDQEKIGAFGLASGAFVGSMI